MSASDIIERNAICARQLLEAGAVIERLKAAVERMAIGVNHIATYRTDKWPDYGTPWEAALEKLGAGREYDMWCCWNAAMCARDLLTNQKDTSNL